MTSNKIGAIAELSHGQTESHTHTHTPTNLHDENYLKTMHYYLLAVEQITLCLTCLISSAFHNNHVNTLIHIDARI